jgi:hypothetical protein
MNFTLGDAVPIEAVNFWPLWQRFINIGGAIEMPDQFELQLVAG